MDRRGVGKGRDVVCRIGKRGEAGYYYSAIRNKVAMGFPSSLSLSPIQLVSHLNGNIRLSLLLLLSGVFLHLVRPSTNSV
jgi:hypothetical protein